MPFTVQSLLARVQPMRPDLDPGLVENMIQETAKRIMRESYLGHVVQTVVPVTGGTNQILLSSRLPYWNAGTNTPNVYLGGSNGLDSSQMVVPSNWAGSTPDAHLALDSNPQEKTAAEVLRVMMVRFAPLPIAPPPSNKGYLVLAGNQTLNAPTGYTAGSFLIIYGSATVTDPSNSIAYVVKTGDVIYSNGVNWSVYPLEQFRTYRQMNAPTVNANSNQPQFTNNQNVNAQQWSQREGQIDMFYNSANVSEVGGGGDVPMPSVVYTGYFVPGYIVPTYIN